MQHFLVRAKLYLTPARRRPQPAEATLLALVARDFFPTFAQDAADLPATMDLVIRTLDAAVLIVRASPASLGQPAGTSVFLCLWTISAGRERGAFDANWGAALAHHGLAPILFNRMPARAGAHRLHCRH